MVNKLYLFHTSSSLLTCFTFKNHFLTPWAKSEWMVLILKFFLSTPLYTSWFQAASEISWSDIRFSWPAQWNFELLFPSSTDLLPFTLQVLKLLFHKVYLRWIVVFIKRDCKGSIYSSFSRTGTLKLNHFKGKLERSQRDDRSRVGDRMWQWYAVGFEDGRRDHSQGIERPLEADIGKKTDCLLELLEGSNSCWL